VFTVYSQTDCHKNHGYSHDFLGGLAAFIFTAGYRLATIFMVWFYSYADYHKNQSIYTAVFLHLLIQ